MRYMFVTPHLQAWIDNLPNAPGRRRKLPEYAQVMGLFDAYVSGESAARLELPGMYPPFGLLVKRAVARLNVWEARLSDNRVFGWCVEPGVFVGIQGANAHYLHSLPPNAPGSHEAHARSVDRWRRVAKFGPSDIWRGKDLNAFLTPPTVAPI